VVFVASWVIHWLLLILAVVLIALAAYVFFTGALPPI
jgi:hypothetical protein